MDHSDWISRIDWMPTILAVSLVVGIFIAWRAQRNAMVNFNLFDLLMENERVSKVAFSYMVVLFVSSWMVISLTLQGKLTDGIFLSYCGVWVTPLVAKMISNKSDLPDADVSTTVTQQITKTTEVSKS